MFLTAHKLKIILDGKVNVNAHFGSLDQTKDCTLKTWTKAKSTSKIVNFQKVVSSKKIEIYVPEALTISGSGSFWSTLRQKKPSLKYVKKSEAPLLGNLTQSTKEKEIGKLPQVETVSGKYFSLEIERLKHLSKKLKVCFQVLIYLVF